MPELHSYVGARWGSYAWVCARAVDDLGVRGEAAVEHLGRAPHDEEGVADVLVRLAPVVVCRPVHDLADGVGEEHHLVLQALHRVRELTDVAVAVRALDLAPAPHQVEVLARRVGEVGRDDLVPRAAEAQLHEADDLGQRDAHGLRLVL